MKILATAKQFEKLEESVTILKQKLITDLILTDNSTAANIFPVRGSTHPH